MSGGRVDDWAALVELPAGWTLVEVAGAPGDAITVDDHEATEVVVEMPDGAPSTRLRSFACPDCGLVARQVRRFQTHACEREAAETRCGVSLRGPDAHRSLEPSRDEGGAP